MSRALPVNTLNHISAKLPLFNSVKFVFGAGPVPAGAPGSA
jgi:hypothetical protein